MIYVPELNNYQCYVVTGNGVIRAYKQKPYNPGYNQNISIDYRDYYINSSYLYQDGIQQFSNYSTIPICLSNDVLTDRYFYRLDIDKIMLVFFIILFICYFIVKKIIRVFFHGFKYA